MESQEQTEEKFHPHFLGFLKFYLSAVVLIVLAVFVFWPGILIGIFVIFFAEMARRAESFYILDSGVAREYKMLSTSRKFAEYSKIQDIGVNQSILQSVFGIGNINFDTAGTDLIEVNFNNIKNPFEIEKIIRGKMAANEKVGQQ